MTTVELDVVLGQRYRDTTTGFAGVATAHCEYLNGTNMVHLENEQNDRWVETERLEGAQTQEG